MTSLLKGPLFFLILETRAKKGPDKRAYIAARRQAKFYLPRQAAAAAARVLRHRSARGAEVHEILFYPSCTRSLVYCGNLPSNS